MALTKEQEAKRDEYMAAKLRYLGYKVNPPAQPQRQTQSLSESYYGDDDYNKPNSWLPQSLQGRDARAWKAAADRQGAIRPGNSRMAKALTRCCNQCAQCSPTACSHRTIYAG